MKIVALAVAAVVLAESASAANELTVRDIFGRDVTARGITLVDWEGQIANAAIRILIEPPSGASFPATATISSSALRLYFDAPSNVGATGPSKTINFPNASAVPVLISIFPDRDGISEDHPLTIKFMSGDGGGSTTTLNVHVVDHDKGLPLLFGMTTDFGEDQTGFFDDTDVRNIVRQAAEDWAYFFADMNLNSVPAGAEQTFIWDPDGFYTGHFRTNANAYMGYLLYAYGIDQEDPPYRSGGGPSDQGGFQASGMTTLPLRRSGGIQIEIKGNFNTLGWYLTTGDDDWWVSGNFGDEPNDLYSIAHHEIGHAIGFNPAYPVFGNFKSAGALQDAQVLAYQGSYPAIDQVDHLDAIDRLSRRGSYGHEYFGDVPARRWLLTKLDLLVLQAIGYTLRPTSAFVPLQITTTALPRAAKARFYSQALAADGGIPGYEWTVVSGALPTGLTLDSFTGVISGTPTQLGTFNFTVRLRDQDEQTVPVTRALSLKIEATPLEITAVQRTGAVVSVSFRTLANHTYTLERNDSLSANGWSVVAANITGTGGIVTQNDGTGGTAPKRFYRVLESP